MALTKISCGHAGNAIALGTTAEDVLQGGCQNRIVIQSTVALPKKNNGGKCRINSLREIGWGVTLIEEVGGAVVLHTFDARM